jgi:regulator of sirC expression with transglutaminase-like and TPR domain
MSSLIDAMRASPPIIEDVALAIAEDVYPGLAKRRYIALLDGWAEQIREDVDGAVGVTAKLHRLNGFVFDTLGFAGNSDEYYDPRNSYLNDVIERRRGIPITLAVVLMALGRRLGILVEGVGFPGHFLVRVGGSADGIFVDPFNDGAVLERDDLLELAQRFMPGNEDLADGQLEPVTVRSMAVRMLFNLQQIYEKRADHPRALVACDRLVDLTDTAFHRRDRGRHLIELGALEAGRGDIEAYLATEPDDVEAAQLHELLTRTSRGAGGRMN